MTDETIANVPILIFGNKIDRPEAISEERLREMFGLYGQTTGKVKKKSLTSMNTSFSSIFLSSEIVYFNTTPNSNHVISLIGTIWILFLKN